MTTGPLGRLEPTDWNHVDKYPLRALAATERPARVPVVIGVNWYSAFDKPTAATPRSPWWIGRDGNLGSVRGGHAVVLVPFGVDEPTAWWEWYDQIAEGICVSEAVTRAMALLNRQRYQPRPLYDVAQANDEWPGENYDGTSVRAGLDVARTLGVVPALRGERHYVKRGEVTRPPLPEHGISANRWAISTDEALEVLGADGRDYVNMANSWGRNYPRRVRMPATVLDRLRSESGEIGIVTDR